MMRAMRVDVRNGVLLQVEIENVKSAAMSGKHKQYLCRRKPLFIPQSEHTRAYDKQGDRLPNSVTTEWEIEHDSG